MADQGPRQADKAGEKKEGQHGFARAMDDLKEKLHHSKLHDAKVGLIQKKYVRH